MPKAIATGAATAPICANVPTPDAAVAAPASATPVATAAVSTPAVALANAEAVSAVAAAVLAALAEIVEFNRPLDYLSVSQQQVSSLTVADLLPVIDEQIHPEQTIWLVVGDLKTIESAVRAANIAPVIVLSE